MEVTEERVAIAHGHVLEQVDERGEGGKVAGLGAKDQGFQVCHGGLACPPKDRSTSKDPFCSNEVDSVSFIFAFNANKFHLLYLQPSGSRGSSWRRDAPRKMLSKMVIELSVEAAVAVVWL